MQPSVILTKVRIQDSGGSTLPLWILIFVRMTGVSSITAFTGGHNRLG